MKLNEKNKPDLQIIQNRYFSVSELRNILRELELGVDNKEFKRRWFEEIVCPPDIIEPNYIGWRYDSAIELIEQYYYLKNRADEYEPYTIDAILMIQKEGMRYRREQNVEFLKLYRAKVKERKEREEAENAGDLDV